MWFHRPALGSLRSIEDLRKLQDPLSSRSSKLFSTPQGISYTGEQGLPETTRWWWCYPKPWQRQSDRLLGRPASNTLHLLNRPHKSCRKGGRSYPSLCVDIAHTHGACHSDLPLEKTTFPYKIRLATQQQSNASRWNDIPLQFLIVQNSSESYTTNTVTIDFLSIVL